MKYFPDKQWLCSELDRLLRKVDATGSVERKCSGGRKRMARTSKNIETVEEIVLRQKEAPRTR